MHNLYFFKARSINFTDQIVYLLTAQTEEEAKQLGISLIEEAYRDYYTKHVNIDFICKTDDVVCFEPD